MSTFILLRDPSKSEIEKITESTNAKVWISKEVNATDFSFSFEKIEIHHDWMQLASNIIKAFPHRVYNGKKLVEHLRYKSSFLFFHTRFILFSRFFLAHQEVVTIEELIEKQKIEGEIFVSGSSPYLSVFEFSKKITVLGNPVTLSKIPKFRFMILSAFRALLSITKLGKYKRARHLFLNPPVKLVPIIDKTTLKPKLGNPPVEYYLDDLLKRKDAFVVEEFYPLREVDYSFSKSNLFGVFRGKTIFLEPFLIRALLKSNTRKDQKTFIKQETSLFNLINNEEKDPILKLANHINHDLKGLRRLAILRMNAAKIFFKPAMKSFGCIDEHSMRVKSLIEPAAEKEILTYALQHGIIHKFHHSYVYLKEDHEFLTIPDKTFTFGTQAADVLLNHGQFAKEKVLVSGQLRTDIIPILKKSDLSLNQFGITKDKPIVLYASQPEAASNDNEQRDLVNADFFRLSKEFPQYQFVLKPHPREVNHQYFHNIAHQIGTTNYQILTEDLYLLLSQCSILLTHSSSVGAEAIYFGKPLLVMDYSNLDAVDYIKEGVGIPATNYSETRDAFVKMMAGELSCDAIALENYRQKYTGTIDGKVSERILNAVVD